MNLEKLHTLFKLIIASVWLVNGLFCKVLDWIPRHQQIIAEFLGAAYASYYTLVIGFFEILMAVWIVSGIKSRINVYSQIFIILLMNVLEFIYVPELLLWGRWNIVFAIVFCGLIYFNHRLNTKIRGYEIYA